MKNPIFLTLFLIFAAVSLGAQTNYYPNSSGTVARSGYIYKYKQHAGFIILYNTDNRFTDVKYGMKDGSLIPEALASGNTPLFEKETWSRQKAFSIVQNAFNSLPDADRKRLEGEKILIEMRIDTSTGKVVDVEFEFLDNDPFRYVPIEIYRQIETDLKSQIWFTLTPDGKKFKYGVRGWIQTIKYVADPTLDPKPPVDPNPKDPIKPPIDPGEPGGPVGPID